MNWIDKMLKKRLVYALPAVIFLGIFSIFPLIQLFRMSFSAVSISNLTKSWHFVGLQNFQAIFSDSGLPKIITNTLIFVAIVSGIGIVGGFAAALVINDSKRYSNFLLAFMVFIWALPPIVNGSVWKFLLGGDGLVNSILLSTHI